MSVNGLSTGFLTKENRLAHQFFQLVKCALHIRELDVTFFGLPSTTHLLCVLMAVCKKTILCSYLICCNTLEHSSSAF